MPLSGRINRAHAGHQALMHGSWGRHVSMRQRTSPAVPACRSCFLWICVQRRLVPSASASPRSRCVKATPFYIIAYAGGLAGGSNRRTALAGVRSPHSLSSQHPWLSVKWVSVLAHYGSHAGTAYACALQQFSAGMGQNSVQHHMRCLAAIMRHEYKNELWIRA